MDPDLGDAAPRGKLDERDQMAIVRVDPTRTDQADDMETTAGASRSIAGVEEGGPGEERAIRNGGVDPRQVLEHGPAGAKVEMADLGVAHLALRQADRILRRAERGVRPVREKIPPDRHPRAGDRVVGGRRPDPEPVDHDEDERAGTVSAHAVVASRAAAVTPARPTMPAISSGFRDAPPTSAPSMEGSATNSPMFAAVTLPP